MSKTPNQVINEYIQLLTTGHVKGLGGELTKEETELCVSLLQAVAADIEFGSLSRQPDVNPWNEAQDGRRVKHE